MVRYALKTAYRDGTTHIVFNKGDLPSLDFMAKLAAPVPSPRTKLTRFHGVLVPNSPHRESVTPVSARKIKPATSDKDADRREAPNPRAGKRKELCWTTRLKRVFNNIKMSVFSACGGTMEIIASIEDPVVIGKILSHLEARSCTPAARSAMRVPASRTPPLGGCYTLQRPQDTAQGRGG